MPLRPLSRAVVLSLATAVLAACGGDPTTSPPPPPPPPPPPSGPASLVVQAGASQVAEPGAPVPVAPVVEVRNAAGTGVSGVVVSFTVETGGGTVAAASATTGSDGRASPGEWRLGPTEGPNTLRASVSGLPSVTIAATAQVVVVSLPPISIGSGGGMVTVNQPGSPIHGMTIQVPAGAYASGQTFSISHSSTAGLTAPPGMTPAGRQIRIVPTDLSLSSEPIRLTVPMTVPAGQVGMLLARDPATGRMVVLPTVSQTATSVTAVLGHFNGALLMAGQPGSAPQGVSATDGGGGMVVVPTLVLASDLDKDRDTGFKPGVDDWEFESITTTVLAPEQFVSSGSVGTQNWYFQHRKAAGALWKRFQEAADVALSNRLGLRWSAVAMKDVFWPVVATADKLLAPAGATPMVAVQSFRSAQASLMANPTEPQFGLLANDQVTVAVTVFRSGAGVLHVTHPTNPGAALILQFSASGMTPVQVSEITQPFTDFLLIQPSLFTNQAPLAGQYNAVLAGTIGNTSWPTYDLRLAWGNTPPESAVLTDDNFFVFGPDQPEVVVYADCLSCPGVERPAHLPAPGPRVAGFDYFEREDGIWQKKNLAGDLPKSVGVAPPNPGTFTMGLVVYGGVLGTNTGIWMDWVTRAGRRVGGTISPAASTQLVGEDITFTAALPNLPGNVEYKWTYTPLTVMTTTIPELTAQWDSPGETTLDLLVRDKTTKQPVANVHTTVTLTEPVEAWRFTSIHKTLEIGNPDPARNKTISQLTAWFGGNDQAAFQFIDYRTILDSLAARVTSGVIFVYRHPPSSRRYIGLQITRNGQAVDLTQIPQVRSWVAPLGQPCPNPNTLPPRFCEVTITGGAKSGTITGLWADQNWITAFKHEDGVTLTGTFRLQAGYPGLAGDWPIWAVEYQFTAVRLPPPAASAAAGSAMR